MTMKTSEVLTEARKLLHEKGWVRGFFAHNKAGEAVSANDPSAVCFCALGAVFKATTTPEGGVMRHQRDKVLDALTEAIPDDCPVSPKSPTFTRAEAVPSYNDYHCPDQDGALAWFDRAIEIAKKAEAQ